MDLTSGYCETRKSLEERGWILTSSLASHLFFLACRNHKSFDETTIKYIETRGELKKSRLLLHDHRAEHGC